MNGDKTRQLVERATNNIDLPQEKTIEVSQPPYLGVDYLCVVSVFNASDDSPDQPDRHYTAQLKDRLTELGFNVKLTNSERTIRVFKHNHSPSMPEMVAAET